MRLLPATARSSRSTPRAVSCCRRSSGRSRRSSTRSSSSALGTGVEIIADELWKAEEELGTPEEFTQVWDLVHQRGTSASPSPA